MVEEYTGCYIVQLFSMTEQYREEIYDEGFHGQGYQQNSLQEGFPLWRG